MRTTLKRVALALALVLPATAHAEPPAVGSTILYTHPNVILCDDPLQIADIVGPVLRGEQGTSAAIYRAYRAEANDRGEPVCALTALRAVIVIVGVMPLGEGGGRAWYALSIRDAVSGRLYAVPHAEPLARRSGWRARAGGHRRHAPAAGGAVLGDILATVPVKLPLESPSHMVLRATRS